MAIEEKAPMPRPEGGEVNPISSAAAPTLRGPRTSSTASILQTLASRQGLREGVAYIAAASLSLLILAGVMNLWRADLRVPFTYYGESMFNGLLVKSIVDHGWFLTNDSVGMPTGLDMRDVPMSDNNFHFLLIKLLSLFTSDYALIINLFFLLTFPLTTACSLYALRQFKVSYLPALFGSLLYTFLPFHFARGQHHIFFATYYIVPLMVLVIVWVCSGALSLKDEETGKLRLNLRDPKLILSLIVCLVIAASGTYFAYFACFFLLVAGSIVTLRRKDLRHLLLPGALIGVIAAGVVVNVLPSIIYLKRHGETPIVVRSPVDSETYGLRVSQLLMPVTFHRNPLLARVKNAFNLRLLINENDDASLGIVGSIGFLLLLGWLFYKRPEPRLQDADADGLMNHLSVLNAAAVLLATIGGFGAIIALIISPKIRAYNRISIYIAFFSLFAVVLLLERFYQGYVKPRGWQVVFCLLLAAALVLGVLDQASARVAPEYDKIKAEYQSDADFVNKLQAPLPQGAMIFQLPVVPFPENPKINRMYDYDHARGYLHTGKLRWSYGAIKSREADAWQKMVAAKPMSEMIETLSFAGFSGVYLDRYGYADNGAKLEGELTGALGAKPLVSGNGRLSFFDLSEYTRRLREKYTPPEWEAKSEFALHPLLLIWQNGCSELEGTAENNWRWCSATGGLLIINGSPHARRVTLEMSFASENEGNLRIDSPLFSEQLKTRPAGQSFFKEIVIPPGQHLIHFTCDARRVLAPLDFRQLVFRVINFKLRMVTVEEKRQVAANQ